jgi:hypothetical protein
MSGPSTESGQEDPDVRYPKELAIAEIAARLNVGMVDFAFTMPTKDDFSGTLCEQFMQINPSLIQV